MSSNNQLRQLIYANADAASTGGGGGSAERRVFRARFTQIGTGDPTLGIIENTLGAGVDSISRQDAGVYRINFDGIVFPEDVFARIDYGFPDSAPSELPRLNASDAQNYRLEVYANVLAGTGVDINMYDCLLEVIAYGDYADFPPGDF